MYIQIRVYNNSNLTCIYVVKICLAARNIISDTAIV